MRWQKKKKKKNEVRCLGYDIIGPWYKCNMTDIMAAIGLVQLERYSEMLKKREGYCCYL
ncbi:DegT/DnrJ/EryC1/StrS family aminotransferase [Bacteroides faecis]|nr:DegT/DnrJ/EryC1/StrS family aminotransferase [Bacteroides faecis]MCS2551302.1 DegT/DnrJ/EryC1/StrS family aminotransferase [Bacteroides faecis]